MRGLLWPLAVIVAFGLGLAGPGLLGNGREVQSLRAAVTGLEAQVGALQARPRASDAGGPGRWQRMRELAADFRAMGDTGADALMRMLAGGNSSEERRAAAQLLGELQVAQALPVLQNILENDSDVLLRRAAAAAL